MKFFVVFTALVAMTVGTSLHRPTFSPEAELQEIIQAINSPSTDPATALLLMQMLAELTGAQQPDISPALVADDVETPTPAPASPLVQIIINVKQPNTVPAPTPVGDDVVVVDDAEEDESTGVEVVDLPAPPVSGVIIADLPAPPSTGVDVADLPAPPSTGVDVADLPAPPSTGVDVADLPAPPSTGVDVADLPAPPSSGVAVADVPKFPF